MPPLRPHGHADAPTCGLAGARPRAHQVETPHSQSGGDAERASFAEELRPTVPLGAILRAAAAPAVIDYMSIDVEGAEEGVMATFPFDR